MPASISTTCSPIRPMAKNGRWTRRRSRPKRGAATLAASGQALPRISDGQLLFLQHMLARMQDTEQGGSRVAIVMNGSPLFTGDAGSGESEIRRWILENDWLEAIVALPEQLFYNTGIATYIWVLTNRKEERRRGKVQLINATDCWIAMRKSLGDKRREISPQAQSADRRTLSGLCGRRAVQDLRIPRTSAIARSPSNVRCGSTSRPARSASNASRRKDAFTKLATSKKKEPGEKAAEEDWPRAAGQPCIVAMLDRRCPATRIRDRRGLRTRG